MDEVSYAMSHGKRVVPLMIEDCPVPFRLARLQYIDFKGDYDSSFANLLKTLDNPDALIFQSSPPPVNTSTKTESKKSSLKPILIVAAIILVAAIIALVFFKNKKGALVTSTSTTDTLSLTGKNIKPEQVHETDQSPKPGKVAQLPIQNVDQNVVPNTAQINLFAPENGS